MADQWYAVVDDATGEAVSFGTVVADPLPEGLVKVAIPRPMGGGDDLELWDPARRRIVKLPLGTLRDGQTPVDLSLGIPVTE